MIDASARTSVPPSQIEPDTQPVDASNTSTSNEIVVPKPRLRLIFNNVRHTANAEFLRLIPDLEAVLDSAIESIVEYIYTPPSAVDKTSVLKAPASFTPTIPPTRSVTLNLCNLTDVVAITDGFAMNFDHKEIKFSLLYINEVCNGNEITDPLSELKGVLTHELVHCYQHDAPPSPPDLPAKLQPPEGLIEGIADFVRLKAGFFAEYWEKPTSSKDLPSKWDEGYMHTAFFLEWLEDERIGRGAVGLLNDRLLRLGYHGGREVEMSGGCDEDTIEHLDSSFWKDLFGADVSELWDEYGQYLDR